MRNLRRVAVSVLAGAAWLWATAARAEPHCYRSDRTCVSARALGADLGPCGDACRTGLCLGDRCIAPDLCAAPCAVSADSCVELAVGNQVATAVWDGSSCGYVVDGCFDGARIELGQTSADVPPRCFEGAQTIAGFFAGDCDGDGVRNRAEGTGQLCQLQQYVATSDMGSLARIGTCPAGGCSPTCPGLALPHGGLACTGTTGLVTYACDTVEGCPSAPAAPARHCVSVAGMGLCAYHDLCGGLARCLDIPSLSTSFSVAFAQGDCDDDGVLNAREVAGRECLFDGDAGGGGLDASVPRDAAGADASGAEVDAAGTPDDAGVGAEPPLGPLSFVGGGCRCRSSLPSRPGLPLTALAVLVLGAIARKRGAPR
jgi:hypothetical protein